MSTHWAAEGTPVLLGNKPITLFTIIVGHTRVALTARCPCNLYVGTCALCERTTMIQGYIFSAWCGQQCPDVHAQASMHDPTAHLVDAERLQRLNINLRQLPCLPGPLDAVPQLRQVQAALVAVVLQVVVPEGLEKASGLHTRKKAIANTPIGCTEGCTTPRGNSSTCLCIIQYCTHNHPCVSTDE